MGRIWVMERKGRKVGIKLFPKLGLNIKLKKKQIIKQRAMNASFLFMFRLSS